MTSTSSVRNLCSTAVSAISILTPDSYIMFPSQAIMAPLSMQKRLSGTYILAPRSLAMSSIMPRRRMFCATPPPSRTSSLPTCAIARSVTSASIAKQVSCTEYAMSSRRQPFLRCASAAVMMPENDTSMPLTE